MSKKLAYERYLWFHSRIRQNRFPNAGTLAERFEISRKQAQRDIDFFRDRLGAPAEYVPERRGYRYRDGTEYEFPPLWLKEEELLAFLLAMRLASALPDRELKRYLNKFLEKFTALGIGRSLNIADICNKVSVKNIEYYRVNERIFHTVVNALLQEQPLRLSYYSPHKDETTTRIIMPLHLLFYTGSWHLIAYCTLRGALRDFALSRIQAVEIVSEKIDLPDSLPSIKEYIRENFGIFSGRESFRVRLRFTPDVSRWVSEQIWHPAQEATLDKNGSLCLEFPAADFREVRREILKYGPDVEVLSPGELRELIKKDIQKMKNLYR
jgi:predicted DNA-binding transcriptional regulator YafY